METEFFITFPNEGPNIAGENVIDLQKHLAAVAPNVNLDRKKTDNNSQDIGTILTVILAGPAVVALAKGISDWLAKQASKPKLIIRDGQGNTIVELDNMPSKDVRALLEGKLGEAVGR